MKLHEALDQELIQRDSAADTANSIAEQIVRAADEHSYQNRRPRGAKGVAHQMANKFHSMVLKAIDEHYGMKNVR